MKKLYVLALSSLFMAGAFAQKNTTRDYNATSLGLNVINITDESRAIGDTIVYFPFRDLFVVNPADQPTFDVETFDLDGLPTNNAGYFTSFGVFFSLDPLDLTPYDISLPGADSAFFWAGTSWFNPVGIANNWLTFGPVSIPATGASLTWRVKNNPGFRDGYRVEVSTTGRDAATDFPGTLIYSRTDLSGASYTPAMQALDTNWRNVTANIPASFGGTQVYIGFNQNANDMDVIYLDEFLVLEANTGSVEGNQFDGFSFNSINPNPAVDVALLNFTLGKNVDANFTVTDINGKVVKVTTPIVGNTGLNVVNMNVEDLNSGIYFVTINAGSYKSTQKMVVAK